MWPARCRLASLCLTVAALAIAAEPKAPAPKAPPMPKEPVQSNVPPPLTVAQWIGTEPLDLAELKGRVVVLVFWGVVNGPSRKVLPRLARLHEKHHERGLTVLGVTEAPKEAAQAFAARHQVSCPLAVDKDGATHDAYRVEFLPTLCLIGRDGTVAWRGYARDVPHAAILQRLEEEE